MALTESTHLLSVLWTALLRKHFGVRPRLFALALGASSGFAIGLLGEQIVNHAHRVRELE